MSEIQLSSSQITLIGLIALWDLVWKGFALWRASRGNDKLWFVLLLIFNTVGILPIVYLFLISKVKSTQKQTD